MMIAAKKSKAQITNRLLAALPENEYQRMFPKFIEIALEYGAQLYEKGDLIGDVYFPNSGIISLIASESKARLAVGIIGQEGLVGLAASLGVKISFDRVIVQGHGSAMKMRTTDFLEECDRGGTLPGILRRFTHSLLAQVSQSTFCCRFHSVDARLARWLLMTADRMASNDFHMTQDFLAVMLGVRREAVNKSAVVLRNSKIIEYKRGRMRILDRPNLEKNSCPCYAAIKAEELSFPVE